MKKIFFSKSDQKGLIHPEKVMKITFIKVTPLVWAIESQNNESFIKVTPLIWAFEGQTPSHLIIKLPTIDIVLLLCFCYELNILNHFTKSYLYGLYDLYNLVDIYLIFLVLGLVQAAATEH